MTEKAFRLDFFIAIAALLISCASAVVLLYQTRVVADQYAAAIWPYISASGTLGPRGFSVSIVNDGLGPALVRSAQLVVDGKPVLGWGDYFKALDKEPEIRAFFEGRRADFLAGKALNGFISSSSIGSGTTMRSGDSLTLMKIDFADAPILAINRHTIAIKLCYCSLNKSCWTLDTTPEKTPNLTLPVTACASDSSIAAQPFRFPSVHRRKI